MKINTIKGDYKYKKDLDDGYLGCICINCGAKKKLTKKEFKKSDSHCSEPDSKKSKKSKKSKIRVIDVDSSKSLTASGNDYNTVDYEQRAKDKVKREVALVKKLKKLNSDLGLEVPEIRRMLSSKDSVSAIANFQLTTLGAISEMVAVAEAKYKDNTTSANAYAFNALLSAAREMIADIQASNDQALLSRRIAQEIIGPNFMNMSQVLVNSLFHIKKGVESYLPDSKISAVNHLIDAAVRDLAVHIQGTHGQIVDEIKEYMTI